MKADAKTYQYTNSFSTSNEINWETGEEMTSSSDTSTASSAVVLSSASESSNTATTAPISNSTIATNNSASSSQSSSGNVVTSNTSSGSSSSFSDLMTESQRRKSFSSKINPKRGTTPVTLVRPDSAGYKYASFGTYNSYASDNKLGNTPIYLLGTIMSINKVGQSNSHYKLAIMVNDCDGYQWYMRATCLKDNFELLKSEINGKAAYIYGIYAGYSGVTNRPMMDMKNVFVVGGNAVSIALYQ